jgi:CubicO group peptidase (beta-lactamase class C family)
MPQVDDSVPQPVPGWLWPLHEMMNRSDARRSCQPASNGVMNARAVARHYAALLPGGVDGVELLPPERIRKATSWQQAPDESPLRMGLGYMIGGEGSPMGGAQSFGHGGYGGSLGFADLETGLAFGLTKNLFSSAPTVGEIVNELRNRLQSQS